MTGPPYSLISSGIGRLHFVEASKAIASAGCSVRFLTGWVPNAGWKSTANFLGRLVGRENLYDRLAARNIGSLAGIDVVTLPWHEAAAQIAYYAGTAGLLPQGRMQASTWRMFGSASSRFLDDIDVVHVRSGGGFGIIDEARRRNIPVIVDHSIAHPAFMRDNLGDLFRSHGLKFDLGPDDPFWKRVLDDCDRADIVLVNSDFVKQTFIEAGYDEDRIRVIYLGYPDTFLRAKANYSRGECLNLLFTGNFCLRKGAQIVAEVLSILDAKGFKYHLDILGDSTEGGHLLAAQAAKGGVTLHGFVPHDVLRRYLQKADIYFFPTLAEGCAKSAMEAMAAGLPIVTTIACGLPGDNGLHFVAPKVSDGLSFSKIIQDLSMSTGSRSSLGISASNLVTAKYDWSAYGLSVLALYKSLINP